MPLKVSYWLSVPAPVLSRCFPPQDTEELQKYRDEVTREVLSAKAALGGRQTPSDGDSKLSSDGPLEASATDVQLLCAALGTALTLADEGEV